MQQIALALVLLAAGNLAAAEKASRPSVVELRSLFYGDNTEFLRNPYRDGDTLLGAQVRLTAALPVGGASVFRLGIQTDSRFGDSDAVRSIWPVIALEVGPPDNTFVFGTLRSGAFGRQPWAGLWPDESGKHGLVPPLQSDTSSLVNSYDAGLQWQFDRGRLQHDVWLSWQKLNTQEHRERFDTGAHGRLVIHRIGPAEFAALAQGHIVHEGGQLFHTGAVGDSLAGGPGLETLWYIGPGSLRTEFLALYSKHNPDRADDQRADNISGYGRFLRVSYAWANWRVAYLRWHNSKNFIKWEGDPNYGALLNDDTAPGPVVTDRSRRYDEFSLSRRFGIGSEAFVVANGRMYRVDGAWDYAYRVAAQVRLRTLIRRKSKGQ